MYRKKTRGWLKHLDFIMLDILCLQVSFMLAYAVRMGPENPYGDPEYRSIGAVLLLADVAVVLLSNTFSGVLSRGSYGELVVTVRQTLLVEAVIIIYLFTLQKSVAYSRFVIYLMAALYVCSGYFTRLLWKKVILSRRSASEKRSLLVVTEAALVREALAGAEAEGAGPFLITGIALLDKDMRGEKILGIPVAAGAEDIIESVCRSWVDEVLIVLPRRKPYPGGLVRKLAGMGVVVHVSVFREEEGSGMRQFVGHMGQHTVLTTSISYATPVQQFIKRLMDLAGGLTGCLITGILLIFLGPVIYISSPGPIFFKQERIGRNGKRFKIYKFRSMYMDAEERKQELMKQNRHGDGLMFKMEADPRIIGCKMLPDGTIKKGVGNFIRDYSLDEFPQFFNVLKGDMSLVGTRPPTVDEWERYEPHHRARMAVRPGITGLWQVSGRSRITDFEEVVKLDTKYITEWSMGMDLKILIKTVKVVFGKEGAM